MITGTNRGATADAEGYYIILLVQPGTHSLEASLVGYQKVVQQDAKVVVGYTTTVDFRLTETALEAEELIVTAQRPLVEPDKTASKYYVTADEIDLQPVVKDAQAWAGLQPGRAKRRSGPCGREISAWTKANAGRVGTRRRQSRFH